MKIRKGFVSNSSSSSFIMFVNNNDKEISEGEFKDKILNSNEIKDMNYGVNGSFCQSTIERGIEKLYKELHNDDYLFSCDLLDGKYTSFTVNEVHTILVNHNIYEIIKLYGIDFIYSLNNFINNLDIKIPKTIPDIDFKNVYPIKLEFSDSDYDYQMFGDLWYMESNGCLLEVVSKIFNWNYFQIERR